MPPSQNYVPQPSRHATGQAVVRLNGKDHYLGRWGTPAAKAEYDRLVAAWLQAGRQIPGDRTEHVSVNEVALGYYRFAESYYRKPDGIPTSELESVRYALKPLKLLYGLTAASAFGPLELKAIRESLIGQGLCRGVINKRVRIIQRAFRWATENAFLGGAEYHAIASVAALKRGRAPARETDPVLPVEDAAVERTLPHMPPAVASMVQVQRLTGCRPGEVVQLRPAELDRTGPVWMYRPREHKTAHHGHERIIFVGPRAQEVLAPWLAAAGDPQDFLFSPEKAEAERNAARRLARRSPMTPSQRKRKAKGRPLADHYDVANYRRAIARACDLANPLPAELAPLPRESRKQWRARLTAEELSAAAAYRKLHRWHPHQLRHRTATELRRVAGIEAARVALGHASLKAAELYGEKDMAAAAELIGRVG